MTTSYDVRRRPYRMTTTRTPDPTVTAPAPTPTIRTVGTVVDQQLVWDAASNLTGVIDHRDPAEWPAGHRPQSVMIDHEWGCR